MIPLPEDHFPSHTGSVAGSGSEKTPRLIRKAVEADLPEVLRLDREAFPEGPYPYFVLRQFLDALGDHMLVVDGGDGLRGYVLATPPHHARSWILSLIVGHELRGNGVGRELMTEMLRQLRAEGAAEILLTVDPANESAVMLYHHLGFAPWGLPREDYLGPGEARLRMRLAC
ncbi:GNAT family N-acetyltransferase [Streptomyces sp. NBC_00820]|uniref:GNAT family N-acetyltransferase n=1 Tax=Streptomyces sp. NBC_00820 TaxID=2975842 RepID=UPI002ED224D5|nr:GNAT family N-acetyltransferase [Streptomyces sp. NBC_00820]